MHNIILLSIAPPVRPSFCAGGRRAGRQRCSGILRPILPVLGAVRAELVEVLLLVPAPFHRVALVSDVVLPLACGAQLERKLFHHIACGVISRADGDGAFQPVRPLHIAEAARRQALLAVTGESFHSRHSAQAHGQTRNLGGEGGTGVLEPCPQLRFRPGDAEAQ